MPGTTSQPEDVGKEVGGNLGAVPLLMIVISVAVGFAFALVLRPRTALVACALGWPCFVAVMWLGDTLGIWAAGTAGESEPTSWIVERAVAYEIATLAGGALGVLARRLVEPRRLQAR